MITYIIKFIICSGLLLGVYRLFLSNERLYRFNRFYLLFSLVFALAVPFITIKAPAINLPYFNTITEQPIAAPITNIQQNVISSTTVNSLPDIIEAPIVNTELTKEPQQSAVVDKPTARPVVQVPVVNYWPQILLAIYGLVASVLLFRFAKNSRYITKLVGKNAVVNYDDTKLVLIDEDITPHSFLNYVFVNKDAYESGELEPEIICHEQTHIRQLHSLDVIFIELLQVVCWLNPFIPFYRRAIQLNHEFLADEAVIENYHDTKAYQYLLLAKISQAASLNFSSQFNYQVTKKRLIMMTKQTSAKMAMCKKLAVLPLLALAIFLFSQKSTAEVINAVKPGTTNLDIQQSKTVTEEYNDILEKYKKTNRNKGTQILHPTETDKKRLQTLFGQMTKEEQVRQWAKFQRQKFPPPLIYPTREQMEKWEHDTRYEIWIDNKKVNNSELINLKNSKLTFGTITGVPSGTQIYLETKKYYNKKYLTDAVWNIVSDGRIPDAKTIEYAKYGTSESANINNGAVDTEPLPDISKWSIPAKLRIKHAATDAPAEVMNAYKAILNKYDIQLMDDKAKGKLSDISSADTAEMHKLFVQMSIKQQDSQYVRFQKAGKPMPKNKVTVEQLQLWQDANIYGVWVNDKKIKNSTLTNYNPNDFDGVLISRLTPPAVKNDGFHYQISLMTKTYFAEFNRKYYSDQSDKLMRIRARGKQMNITSDKIYQPKNVMNNADKPQFHIVTTQEWKNIMGVSLNLHQGVKDIGIPIHSLKNVNEFIRRANREYHSDYRLMTMQEFEYFVHKHPSTKILKDKLLIIRGHINNNEDLQAGQFKFPPPIINKEAAAKQMCLIV